MGYRSHADESVRSGIRRSAGEQLDRAISELSERIATDPVDAVHTARKAVKKERSLLRLARGSMPKQRRRENAALRDAARGLSAARDAEAMLATLDGLATRYAGQVPEATFDGIRTELLGRRDRQRAQQWRKRVKDLWYQQRLLGDDHDLAVLRTALRRGTPTPVDLDAVIGLIDHRRGELQGEALSLGAAVYAETPSAYVKRMRRLYRAGRTYARARREDNPAALAEATRAPTGASFWGRLRPA